MGNILSLMVTDVFLGEVNKQHKPWTYADDMRMIITMEEQELNSMRRRIWFTSRAENNGSFHFLNSRLHRGSDEKSRRRWFRERIVQTTKDPHQREDLEKPKWILRNSEYLIHAINQQIQKTSEQNWYKRHMRHHNRKREKKVGETKGETKVKEREKIENIRICTFYKISTQWDSNACSIRRTRSPSSSSTTKRIGKQGQ